MPDSDLPDLPGVAGRGQRVEEETEVLFPNRTGGDCAGTEQGAINAVNVRVFGDDHHNRRLGWEARVENNAESPVVVTFDQ